MFTPVTLPLPSPLPFLQSRDIDLSTKPRGSYTKLLEPGAEGKQGRKLKQHSHYKHQECGWEKLAKVILEEAGSVKKDCI
jgi:hypothetical protein